MRPSEDHHKESYYLVVSETKSPPPKPLAAAGWLTIAGAAIGIFGGIIFAGLLSISGLTSANLPPLPSHEGPKTPKPIVTSSPTPTSTSKEPQPELTTTNKNVPPGQRFDLTGQIPGLKDGASLRVQVKDGKGPWVDFPVTAAVRDGGKFATEIYTTRTGTRTFRLKDEASGKTTPTLNVKIG